VQSRSADSTLPPLSGALAVRALAPTVPLAVLVLAPPTAALYEGDRITTFADTAVRVDVFGSWSPCDGDAVTMVSVGGETTARTVLWCRIGPCNNATSERDRTDLMLLMGASLCLCFKTVVGTFSASSSFLRLFRAKANYQR
jgi:hypothetical protein